MSKTIHKVYYKPKIINEKRVVYKNPKGGQTVCNFFSSTTIALPKALGSLITIKNGNSLSANDLLEKFWSFTEHIYNNEHSVRDMQIMQRAETLINHYGKKSSEGEKEGIITQKEQFEIMEQWKNWFGYDIVEKK